MQDTILTVSGWLIGAILAAGGWLIGQVFGRLKDHEAIHRLIDKKIDDHRIHVAENYSPKEEMKNLQDTIVAHLVRIEDKLDKKADKP